MKELTANELTLISGAGGMSVSAETVGSVVGSVIGAPFGTVGTATGAIVGAAVGNYLAHGSPAPAGMRPSGIPINNGSYNAVGRAPKRVTLPWCMMGNPNRQACI